MFLETIRVLVSERVDLVSRQASHLADDANVYVQLLHLQGVLNVFLYLPLSHTLSLSLNYTTPNASNNYVRKSR